MSTTFYFIILNLIDNYDLSKCAQVHCGLWFFGLLQLTLSFHIHIFPHRFSPHWANGAPPPLQPLLHRRLHLLAPQLLSQLHALPGPTGQLQPPDGNFHTMYRIISYCIISFDIDSIPSICILYILYQLALCTPYYITHIISNHFPKSSFAIQFICRENSFQKKPMVSASKKQKGVLSFRGWPHHTLRALPRN